MNSTSSWLDPFEYYEVLLVWIAGEFCFNFFLALLMRHCLVHKDATGKVDYAELPKLPGVKLFEDYLPKQRGGLYDFGIVSTTDVLWSSFSFAIAYSGLAVITCNHAFSAYIDPKIGYLVAIVASWLSMVFMCAFACNAIHVLTNHQVHFIYYGLGFVPIALYWRLPSESWLVAVACLVRLFFNTALKYYVWPNYPSTFKISPSFRYNAEKKIVLVTDPETYDVMENPPNLFAVSWPFPNYEILNGIQASSLCTGGIIGVIVSALVNQAFEGRKTDPYYYWVLFGTSLLSGFLVGLIFVVLLYHNDRWRAVERYWPRSLTVFTTTVAAPFVAANVDESIWGPAQYIALGFVIVIFVFHALLLSLFVYVCMSASMHLGAWAPWKRMLIPGDGGARYFYEEVDEKEGEQG